LLEPIAGKKSGVMPPHDKGLLQFSRHRIGLASISGPRRRHIGHRQECLCYRTCQIRSGPL